MATVSWDEPYLRGLDYTLSKTKTIADIYNVAAKHEAYLDLGCGTGHLTREMWHRGFKRVLGVDGSKAALDLAKNATTQPIEYRQIDLDSSFAKAISEKFDLITCKYTLAFIEDTDQFFQEVKQLLTPNGYFVILSPNRDSTPEESLSITVEAKKVKEKLQKYFVLQEYYTTSIDEFYICKK